MGCGGNNQCLWMHLWVRWVSKVCAQWTWRPQSQYTLAVLKPVVWTLTEQTALSLPAESTLESGAWAKLCELYHFSQVCSLLCSSWKGYILPLFSNMQFNEKGGMHNISNDEKKQCVKKMYFWQNLKLIDFYSHIKIVLTAIQKEEYSVYIQYRASSTQNTKNVFWVLE